MINCVSVRGGGQNQSRYEPRGVWQSCDKLLLVWRQHARNRLHFLWIIYHRSLHLAKIKSLVYSIEPQRYPYEEKI